MANDPSEDGNEAGGLRARLEATLAENRELKAQMTPLLAAQVISAKNYKFVAPEDLAGVDPKELEAKAATLEEANRKVHANVLRNVLADQGVPDAELDEAVERYLDSGKREDHAATSGRLATLGRITGTIPESDKDKGLTGKDRIKAALEDKYAKRR